MNRPYIPRTSGLSVRVTEMSAEVAHNIATSLDDRVEDVRAD